MKTELDVFGPYIGTGMEEIEVAGQSVQATYATISRLHCWHTKDLISLKVLIDAELSRRQEYNEAANSR